MPDFAAEKEISADTIEQIYRIAKDYTRDYFTDTFPDELRIDMGLQRAVFLREGAEIVSCIVFTCLDGSAHITMMATKRSHAGAGLGTLLMRRFEEHVSQLGLHSIELYTFSPRSKSAYASTVGFYQKAGFSVIKEHAGLWEPGTVTLKMRKSW